MEEKKESWCRNWRNDLKDGKVLLGKRHDDPEKASSLLKGAGTWTMPGGKLDFSETFVWDQKEYVKITEECEGKTIHREVKKQVSEGKYQIIVNGKVIKEFTIK